MIQIATRLVYENQWLSLREDEIRLPDGSPGTYSVVDKPTAVLVVPMERGGCHLVEQYRYPIGRRSWEFPQGTWPDGRIAQTEELARAELREETGLRAGALWRLGRMAVAPGITSQEGDIFVATELSTGPPAREHTEQGMAQRWFSRTELTAMIDSAEIVDALTMAAFVLLDRKVAEFG